MALPSHRLSLPAVPLTIRKRCTTVATNPSCKLNSPISPFKLDTQVKSYDLNIFFRAYENSAASFLRLPHRNSSSCFPLPLQMCSVTFCAVQDRKKEFQWEILEFDIGSSVSTHFCLLDADISIRCAILLYILHVSLQLKRLSGFKMPV